MGEASLLSMAAITPTPWTSNNNPNLPCRCSRCLRLPQRSASLWQWPWPQWPCCSRRRPTRTRAACSLSGARAWRKRVCCSRKASRKKKATCGGCAPAGGALSRKSCARRCQSSGGSETRSRRCVSCSLSCAGTAIVPAARAPPLRPQFSPSGLSLAHLADRRQLRRKHRYLALDRRDFLPVACRAPRLLGLLQRLVGLGLVEVMPADGGVGKHRDQLWLHLENPTCDEDELLLAPARRLDAHRAGPDARNERSVARIDAELAGFARQHHELRLAREDRFFRADDVDVDGVCQAGLLLLSGRSAWGCSRLLLRRRRLRRCRRLLE